MYGYFKRQASEILHEKTRTWLRKANLRRETESLQVATENNAIRTNYIIEKRDTTQQNSWYRLCGDRDEMINHIIREYIKLGEMEYKTRQN